MKSKLPGALVCGAVVCVILMLGLWPFHAPKNEVAWLKGTSGLFFGRFGSVQTLGSLKTVGSESGRCGSIEVWVQPDRWNKSATILAFYAPQNRRLFELQQSLSDLKLVTQVQSDRNQTVRAHLYAGEALLRSLLEKKPVFLAVVYGRGGTRVYLDGALVEAAAHFGMPRDAFTGRVIVGDAPGQSDSFEGEIRGLAIYDAELGDTQVSRHYETWKNNRHPEIAENERNVALYLFDEGAGTVIHNRSAHGVDLSIPQAYSVVDKIALEPFWREFNLSRSYGENALMNIVGFVPLGLVFYVYFRLARPIRRAMLVTIAMGTATSLTIEVLQAFLPTTNAN